MVAIGDVGDFKEDGWSRRVASPTCSIGQLVQIDDFRTPSPEMAGHGGANKAGTAGDQDLHCYQVFPLGGT